MMTRGSSRLARCCVSKPRAGVWANVAAKETERIERLLTSGKVPLEKTLRWMSVKKML